MSHSNVSAKTEKKTVGPQPKCETALSIFII